jgi:very-short-patch-repair endonuclease
MGRQPPVPYGVHGVFTRAQARTAGWPDRQVRRMVEVGHWVRVAGVGLTPRGQEIGPRELGAAAVLTWPEAVISHRLAGALWGLPGCAGDIATVIVPLRRVLRGYRLQTWRSDLSAADVGQVFALVVTTRERTAVDLLASLPWSQARNLWAWLATRGVLDLDRLASATSERKHRCGTPQLRRLLDVSRTGSLSAAEDLCHELLRDAGIHGWRANASVLVSGRIVANVDLLFEEQRVAVEIDGWSTHRDRATFQRDRATQNQLVAAGYLVLRFTWDDLTSRPAYVVSTIRQALARIV